MRTPRLALLVAYLFTGLLGGVAHGRERIDAPVRIESTRHERCPTIHDPQACALCSYSHARATAANGATVAIPVAPAHRWQPPVLSRRSTAPPVLQPAARGPPATIA